MQFKICDVVTTDNEVQRTETLEQPRILPDGRQKLKTN